MWQQERGKKKCSHNLDPPFASSCNTSWLLQALAKSPPHKRSHETNETSLPQLRQEQPDKCDIFTRAGLRHFGVARDPYTCTISSRARSAAAAGTRDTTVCVDAKRRRVRLVFVDLLLVGRAHRLDTTEEERGRAAPATCFIFYFIFFDDPNVRLSFKASEHARSGLVNLSGRPRQARVPHLLVFDLRV